MYGRPFFQTIMYLVLRVLAPPLSGRTWWTTLRNGNVYLLIGLEGDGHTADMNRPNFREGLIRAADWPAQGPRDLVVPTVVLLQLGGLSRPLSALRRSIS
jgi:hypothetical protein